MKKNIQEIYNFEWEKWPEWKNISRNFHISFLFTSVNLNRSHKNDNLIITELTKDTKWFALSNEPWVHILFKRKWLYQSMNHFTGSPTRGPDSQAISDPASQPSSKVGAWVAIVAGGFLGILIMGFVIVRIFRLRQPRKMVWKDDRDERIMDCCECADRYCNG